MICAYTRMCVFYTLSMFLFEGNDDNNDYNDNNDAAAAVANDDSTVSLMVSTELNDRRVVADQSKTDTILMKW